MKIDGGTWTEAFIHCKAPYNDYTYQVIKCVSQDHVLTDSIMEEDGTCDLQLVVDSN